MRGLTPSVEALIFEGRFEEALKRMRTTYAEGGASLEPGIRLVLADLLERTGRLPESRELLGGIARSVRLTDADRAEYHLLDGLLLKHSGHLPESAIAFQKACDYAAHADSLEVLCWSQLRLLGVAGDAGGGHSTEEILGGLRRNIERAAVPSVSIAYHIFTAEQHAKRGQLAASRRHSELAGSLLASHPNVWLRGLLELQYACLYYLEGDFPAALVASRCALAASGQSGHLHTRLIALLDMAAAYLAAGQPARAQACIDAGLAIARPEESVWGLLLETLAEAQLVNRDVSGCRESLDRAERTAAALGQTQSSWNRTWNLRTAVRLLQRSESWGESLKLIQAVGKKGLAESGSFTAAQVEALETVALSHVGPAAAAAQAVLRLSSQQFESSMSCQGLIVTASASLLEFIGARSESIDYFARALRILGATGEASSLVEAADQFILVLRRASGTPQTPMGLESVGLMWRPTELVCHLNASSSVLPPSRPTGGDVIAFLGTLPELRTAPRSLGEETLRLLSAFGWIRDGVVTQTSGDGKETVVASCSDCPPIATTTRRDLAIDPDVRVHLGTKLGRRYDLLVVPSDHGASAVHCGEIARMLAVIVGSEPQDDAVPAPAKEASETQVVDDEFGLFLSPSMTTLLTSAKRVAPLRVTILLTGESGTGKEVIAGAIHRYSGTASAPFVALNCATVPRDMLESQLFGYRRGAFTGAVQSFQGVIRAAEGGTLFLDEIGELSLEVQPKLLRFLDSGEIQPLGEATPHRVGVRVIAATNADLETLMKQGRFREDLYYRLNVVHLQVPPLRERRDEIAPFVSRFLTKYTEEFGKSDIRLSDEALEHLLLYSWPGNVRQLSHEMRRLAALQDSGSCISPWNLRPEVRNPAPPPLATIADASHTLSIRIDRPLSAIVRDVESAALKHALGSTSGQLELAAKRLGLSRKGLYLKRQRLGLTR